jgi:hypothetical protein
VGVAKKSVEGEENMEEESTGNEEEKKFESSYLDRNLGKEKKKSNKEAARLMKLLLTDGLNEMEAIESERLKNMEYFDIGQKLFLNPPIEVRRGILFLTCQNVTYLGKPIIPSTPPVPPITSGGNTGQVDPPKRGRKPSPPKL